MLFAIYLKLHIFLLSTYARLLQCNFQAAFGPKFSRGTWCERKRKRGLLEAPFLETKY